MNFSDDHRSATAARQRRRATTAARSRSGLLLTVAAGVAALGIVVPSAPVAAGPDLGANYVTLSTVDISCEAGQAYPCPPGVGLGDANTIHVTQSLVDGHFVYDGVTGTALDPDDLWLQVQWEGDCNAGYHLIDGKINDRMALDDHGYVRYYTTPIAPFATTVDVPEQNSYTTQVPVIGEISAMLQHFGFDEADPTAHLLALAEDKVHDRVDAGMTESEARAVTEEVAYWVTMPAYVACKGNVFGLEYYEIDASPLRVDVVFHGADADPGVIGQPQPGDLATTADVEQVELTVTPDPTDACTVHATVTFVTDQSTDISYRIVDLYGVASEIYQVHVDQALVAMVDHEIDVLSLAQQGPAAGGSGGIDVEAGAAPGKGSVDNVLHVEVLSPEYVESDYEGYSVQCRETTFDTPTGVLANPSRQDLGELPVGELVTPDVGVGGRPEPIARPRRSDG